MRKKEHATGWAADYLARLDDEVAVGEEFWCFAVVASAKRVLRPSACPFHY